MAREPKIAYVLLRNAHFGPRLAASVELCVRDLILHSRHARSTLVVCPPVDQPFDGIEIATIPDASIAGNLGKAWSVARLLRRRGVDLAIVENHLPAATVIASGFGRSGDFAQPRLREGAVGRARSSRPRPRAAAALRLRLRQRGLRQSVSREFPWRARAHAIASPTDWIWPIGGRETPKDRMILSVGRALKAKGHIEAMGAIARALTSRPEWKARFILSDAAAGDREPETVQALHEAARAFGGRVRIDQNLPYADVKAAWESAAVGIVLTKGPEPFGRTALEALAGGAALITSGLGGLAEICGDCAVTVDPNDADLVAAALGGLMDAPERRAGLARAGRERVEALFDIRTVARRMDDFIEACVGEGRGQT